MSRARTGLSNLATAYPRPVALGAPMVFLFVLGLTFPAQTQAVTPEKLAASPLDDNVQYLRFGYVC